MMRRVLSLFGVLSLVMAGIAPLTSLSTADHNENAKSALITNARVPGTVAVVSSKRSPVVHGNVPAIAIFGPARTSTLFWIHELAVLLSPACSPQADRLPTSPRAPPSTLTSSAA
jgi:hypothetical protein